MPNKTKIFNGKRYELWMHVMYKKMAQGIAKNLNKEGKLARIIKTSEGYAIYSRSR